MQARSQLKGRYSRLVLFDTDWFEVLVPTHFVVIRFSSDYDDYEFSNTLTF